jgi:hypothetical protein
MLKSITFSRSAFLPRVEMTRSAFSSAGRDAVGARHRHELELDAELVGDQACHVDVEALRLQVGADEAVGCRVGGHRHGENLLLQHVVEDVGAHRQRGETGQGGGGQGEDAQEGAARGFGHGVEACERRCRTAMQGPYPARPGPGDEGRHDRARSSFQDAAGAAGRIDIIALYHHGIRTECGCRAQ